MKNIMPNKLSKFLIVIGVGILLICYQLFHTNKFFYIHYLAVFSFFISLSIGAAFLVVLQFLTRGGWGVIVRRVPEHLMSMLPLFALFFIPILFGVDSIFEWLDPYHIKHDVLIQKKMAYLNLPFFIIRNIFYFITFSIIGSMYWRLSIAQDTSSDNEESYTITRLLQRRAPLYQSNFLYFSCLIYETLLFSKLE